MSNSEDIEMVPMSKADAEAWKLATEVCNGKPPTAILAHKLPRLHDDTPDQVAVYDFERHVWGMYVLERLDPKTTAPGFVSLPLDHTPTPSP